jgi:hypothetical protein
MCVVWVRSVHTYPAEGVDVGGLVLAGEPALVALAVGGDVLRVPQLQLLDRRLDHLEATVVPHGLGAVVCVSTGTVPVTRDGLRVEGHNDASDLSDPLLQTRPKREQISTQVLQIKQSVLFFFLSFIESKCYILTSRM